jgi:hypothetical protein
MGRPSKIRSSVGFWIPAAVVLLAGCFNPTIENGGFACDPTQVPACPDNYFCVDGLCRTSKTPVGGGSSDLGDMTTVGVASDMSGAPSSLDMSHSAPAPDLASGSSCAHDPCATGAKLVSGCDACVTKICAQDSYCCTTKWSTQCVQEVSSICSQTCP